MKVYLATSGEYSDYRVEHVFARREDAEAYAGGDQVEEYEVRDGPVEMRPWHTLVWNPDLGDRERTSLALENPHWSSWPKDFDGREGRVEHHWNTPPVLYVEGWDLQRVRKVYSEQRAQYLVRVATGCQVPE